MTISAALSSRGLSHLSDGDGSPDGPDAEGDNPDPSAQKADDGPLPEAPSADRREDAGDGDSGRDDHHDGDNDRDLWYADGRAAMQIRGTAAAPEMTPLDAGAAAGRPAPRPPGAGAG